MKFGSK
ncbi:hypothetical protein SAMN02927914_00494 [Mesorhizobium qingshengii]|nr:hypothetical protein SAMN02927914_00494 [Mesorhizobium qingshengii]